MSTRGLAGCTMNGETKAMYCYCDAYPDWLGQKIVDFLKSADIEKMRGKFPKIEMVNPTETASKDCVNSYSKLLKVFGHTGGSDLANSTWYQLLHDLQGSMDMFVNDEINHMTDDSEFLKDGTFCKYAYIFNLDTSELEFYPNGIDSKKVFTLDEIRGKPTDTIVKEMVEYEGE